MKYIVSLWLITIMTIGSLYAGEEGEYEKNVDESYSVVQKFEADFKVQLNDDRTITASWGDFSGEGFDWYKLMYSTTNNAPVYPKDHVAFIGNVDQTEATFKLKYGKTHYIRICAITVEQNYRKGLYCSDVQKIETSLSDVSHEDNEKKKEYLKNELEAKKEVKRAALSERLQNRVNAMLKNFMSKLESKGYSDDKKLVAIDRVISKLEGLKDKNPRYSILVVYMMEKLEEYRSEIDDGFGEIESIFEDFE